MTSKSLTSSNENNCESKPLVYNNADTTISNILIEQNTFTLSFDNIGNQLIQELYVYLLAVKNIITIDNFLKMTDGLTIKQNTITGSNNTNLILKSDQSSSIVLNNLININATNNKINITGDLFINNSSTIITSTSLSSSAPYILIGLTNTGTHKGIRFKYNLSSLIGFFGFNTSNNRFTCIPNITELPDGSNILSGTLSDAEFNALYINIINSISGLIFNNQNETHNTINHFVINANSTIINSPLTSISLITNSITATTNNLNINATSGTLNVISKELNLTTIDNTTITTKELYINSLDLINVNSTNGITLVSANITLSGISGITLSGNTNIATLFLTDLHAIGNAINITTQKLNINTSDSLTINTTNDLQVTATNIELDGIINIPNQANISALSVTNINAISNDTININAPNGVIINNDLTVTKTKIKPSSINISTNSNIKSINLSDSESIYIYNDLVISSGKTYNLPTNSSIEGTKLTFKNLSSNQLFINSLYEVGTLTLMQYEYATILAINMGGIKWIKIG